MFFVRPSAQRRLALVCIGGLLALGLAASALGADVTGGQGGSGFYNGGNGGNSGNGGGGGQAPLNGVAGANGSGGAGGDGFTNYYGYFGAGGAGGIGNVLTVNSIVITAPARGGNGGNGTGFASGGGGGGGGGDGIYAANAITITNQSTITGGNAGYGGSSSLTLGGGGGGGGNGLAGNNVTLVNYGTITGGTGGTNGRGDANGGSGNGGGGHGVVGSNLTISNSGTIMGGEAGALVPIHGAAGTPGDAILFTGGSNILNLLTGSTISGNLEVASGANVSIAPQNSGLSLSSGIVLDDNTTSVSFDTTLASLTVASVISGGGAMLVDGAANHRLILTGANTFTGGTTVNSSDLQVDGAIADVTLGGGAINGVGTVGNLMVNGGRVMPGEANQMFAALTAVGNANFATPSTLAIRSTDGSVCSTLHAEGALTLSGTLSIHFESTPTLGATCRIATASGVSGTFTNIASAPATVSMSYYANAVQFTVTDNSDSIFADGFTGE